MTNWHCDSGCKVSRGGAGPWDDKTDCFSNIKHAHKDCPSFQIGEPNFGKLTEVEQLFTDYFNQNIHQWHHSVIAELKGPEKVCQIKDKWKWVSQT